MCSIDYLSKKSALCEGLYRTQLLLFEERKKYDNILEKETIATNSNYINSALKSSSFDNQYNSRNQSIKDNFKKIEEKLEKILKTDHPKLTELKKKYELSVKNANEKIQNDNTVESKSESEHFISEISMIKKNIIDENIKEVYNLNNKSTIDEVEESEKTISIPSIQSDIPKISVISPKSMEAKHQMNLDLSSIIVKYNSDNSPMISPRVRDSRDRMKEKINYAAESEEYYNVENFEPNESSPGPLIDSYLKIFEEIHKSMKCNGNYQQQYLSSSRTSDIIENQLSKNIKNFINSTSTYQMLTDISSQDLIRYMLHWLPKFCSILKIDVLNLTADLNFCALMDQKPQISFEELNSKIILKLCTSNDSKKLWIKLTEHFHILVQDNFLDISEIAEIFTSLLISLSPMDNKRIQVFKLLEWCLVLIKEKYKEKDVESKSVNEMTVFSDEDSINMSSMSEKVILKKQENAVTYNQLKQSLNLVDDSKTTLLEEDDDPNADINLIFTTSIKKTDNNGLNESKDRLIKSIRNIDDEFLYTLPDRKEPNKKADVLDDDDSDSDFDFYK